ncbi:hypothetical protein BJX62DRAFT_215353 [Aspergillus germanicus]
MRAALFSSSTSFASILSRQHLFTTGCIEHVPVLLSRGVISEKSLKVCSSFTNRSSSEAKLPNHSGNAGSSRPYSSRLVGMRVLL